MEMKNIIYILIILAFSSVCFANSAPTVRDVTAKQRTDGSGVVDIYYTLSDADNDKCSISLVVSSNGGTSWNITPSASALKGQFTNVSKGRWHLTWNSKADLPGGFGTNFKFKVTADDVGMTWVYINDPGVPSHEPFNGYMSKYETTNAQYCKYLNAAKASGDITVSGNNVLGAGGSNNGGDFVGLVYYNLAGPGSTVHGVTNGGAARINFNNGLFTVDTGFENHPVTYVSWYGSTAFARYYGYRLPTEWEWQAVADYDRSYIYGCGTSINSSIANYRNSIHPDGTTVVGTYGIYGYGLSDMAGNVWEWTSLIYSGSTRLLCGGPWSDDATNCTVTFRFSINPLYCHSNLGFRVCQYDLERGLVAHYKFDGTSGAVVDETGNNNGTNYDATRGITGKVGNCFSFDGNDYVNVDNLRNIAEEEEGTFSIWVNIDSIPSVNGNFIFEHLSVFSSGYSKRC